MKTPEYKEYGPQAPSHAPSLAECELALRDFEVTVLEQSLKRRKANPYAYTGKGREIVAHVPYGVPSIRPREDGYRIVLMPGAFAECSKYAADARLNHDGNLMMASSGHGTMQVTETPTGLSVRITEDRLSERTRMFNILAKRILTNAVSGLSPGGVFTDSALGDYKGEMVRFIQAMDAIEFSFILATQDKPDRGAAMPTTIELWNSGKRVARSEYVG